jgi:membrane-associated phospholipid phosphatase
MRGEVAERLRGDGMGVTWPLIVLGVVMLFFAAYKTLFVPVLLVAALAIPAVRQAAFLRAWLPFLTATILFDLTRGGIFHLVQAGARPIYIDYVMRWESALVGVPALPLIAQRVSSPWLDGIALTFHLAHFVYFLAIGIWIWLRDPKTAAWWQRAMVLTMLLGLLGYIAVPTAPPWLAAEAGAIPPLRHAVAAFYGQFMPQLHQAFDTNPVAAMPSLHTAFPVVCALIAQRMVGWRGRVLLWLYVAGLAWAVIYLGEHFLVDVLAGAVTAGAAVWITKPRAASFYDEFSA